MNTLMQSEVFFFISSVGFIILWILMAIFLIYLIRAMNSFSRMMNKVEKNVGDISDEAKEMVEDIRESTVFQFLFKKKRKHRGDKSAHSRQ